ncbi:4-hydroxy-3-methylbut-2-enyl diphosphate reductase [Candidatus Woesearchaeota archaeon]|nr:4-hydroxy-3-methylbut-2-enyl diphosphate reductase [Candidatus Woesearchaeota archaeon]
MVKKILLASPRGFCAGVERAINVVEKALEAYGNPIYVKHQIVHNTHVVKALEKKGAIFIESIKDVPAGSRLIFSAHGVPPSTRQEAEAKGLKVIDATCPLVTKVHIEAKRYAKEGYSIILIGHKGHVELEGTAGEAPEATQVIETEQEAEKINVPDESKVVCLTQTTLSIDDTRKVIEALKKRFPKITFPPKEDICYATQNRQNAVKEISKQAELILVIGSKNSSNSNRLVDVAKERRVKAHLINDITELKQEWLNGISRIGITAGASAPEHLIKQTIEYLKKQGATTVTEEGTGVENIQFVLPRI